MSKKYLEQVSSTGISRKKVESKFGMKILAKCGWTDGEGLGKNKDGIVDCIQIRKKEDNLGLGASVKQFNWNDQWWQNSYDSILKNMNLDLKNEIEIESEEEEEIIVIKKQNKKTKRKNCDSDDESSISTMSENSEKEEKKKSQKNKKMKKIESDEEEQEESQFLHKKRKRMIKILKL